MIRATSRHSRIASIGDLARVSLRMQVLFIVTLILAIIMLALCYWMISSLINVASTDARQHFQKLAYNLHGQESFLARAIKNESHPAEPDLGAGRPASFELIDSDASTYTYEGQSGSLAMPYIIKVSRNDSATGGDYSRRLQTVAAGLSNLYGSYRSPWQQPGMQVFLLDLNNPLSISVPCSEDSMTDDVHRWWRCPLSANRVRELIYTQTAKVSPSECDGSTSTCRAAGRTGSATSSTARLNCRMPCGHRDSQAQSGAGHVFRNARRITATPHTPDLFPVPGHHARPRSRVRRPHEHGALEEVDSNVRFGREGVLIDTWCQDGWAAAIWFPYDRFFEAARWQPLSFVGLLLLCVVGSIVLYRRHRNLVVRRPRPVTNGWSKANPSTAP